jgi:hypothetical protein
MNENPPKRPPTAITLGHVRPAEYYDPLHGPVSKLTPGFHVMNQFPDGMGRRNRMRKSLFGRDPFKDLLHRVPVPCLSVEGGEQFISDVFAFRVHKKHNMVGKSMP